MKRLLPLFIAIVACLAIAPATLAGSPSQCHPGGDYPSCTPSFGLAGTVTAVDAENRVLTVDVRHGSNQLSGSVDLLIAAETELFSVVDCDRTPIALTDVAVDDEIAAFGTVDKSSGTAVYTANVILDGVSADALPRPDCRLRHAKVKAAHAHKGDKLRLRLKITDAMPGCTSAKVMLTIRTAKGRKVTSATMSGLALNEQVTVKLKLRKTLRHGTYRLVATSTDWAGNHQARTRTAVLKVK